ncbi:MAG: hypothetical protein U9N30_05205, partial [Campylobacterota bacterium]|nr:hypothetical protein [Campylobacterota bacterium]
MKFIGGLLFSILSLVANEVNIAVPSNEMQLAKNPPITLAWLKDKPRTITKDFYISQYFKQEISSHEALEALGQAKNVNNKLFYAFAKKFNHDETYAVAQCMQAKTNNLINQHIDCIEVGLSMYDATKLNYDQLDTLIQRLEPIYETHAKQLKIINATIPFIKLTSSPNDVFFGVFNHCGSVYRGKHFNYPLSRRTLKRLSKDKRFQSSIARIVLNQNLPLMQESLLEINDAKYSHATSFYLALNAIK